MNSQVKRKAELRVKRSLRVRKHLRGTAEKPRLCVVKSNCHIEVQLINDVEGKTIGSASTFDKESRNTEYNKRNKASAKKLGERIAALGVAAGVKEAVFDRGSSKYHGVLAELADAARAGGLQF